MSSTVPHQPQPGAARRSHEPAAGAASLTAAPRAGAPGAWSGSVRQLKQGRQLTQLQEAPAGSGTGSTPGGLPAGLRAGIESLSGLDMSGVRVHRNSAKPATLQAHAYAQGQDIHLGPGQERHLPHEAWHVVQQAQGRVRPTLQLKAGVPVNDDAGLEREADTMGARAAALGGAQVLGPLQTAPPGMAGAAPVQRMITVNHQDYQNESDFAALCKLIGAPRMKQLGSTSKKLREWVLHKDSQGTFGDENELFDTLAKLRERGVKAQQIGEERESRAGGSAGDLSSGRQRGEQIYEKNGVQLLAGFQGQDPYLRHPDGSVLPLDTVSPTVWGLVGGPAKAKSPSAVDQELGRLRVLQKCCLLDGSHQGEVRYNEIKDTQEREFSRLVEGALARGITVYVNGTLQRRGGTAKNIGRAVGTAAGIYGGIYGGIKLGAALGTTLGPVGTVLGGALGGIGGYLLGGKVGEQVGQYF